MTVAEFIKTNPVGVFVARRPEDGEMVPLCMDNFNAFPEDMKITYDWEVFPDATY